MLSMGAWADNVAKIGTTEYATLAEAFAAVTDNTATTIEVLADCSGNGIIVPSGRDITVNFNNHTYTVNTDVLAGSNGTKTQCFQLLRDSKVTFTNGKIVADNVAIKMIIQNYSDLTLTGMTIDATEGTNNVGYVVSNNNGNTLFGAGTTITAKDGGVAFDVYSFKTTTDTYTGAKVTVDGATINGKIEVGASNDAEVTNLGLVLTSGTINGEISLGNRAEEAVVTKSEDFNVPAPADHKWDASGKLVPKVYVAKIGDNKYEGLAEAVIAATAGQTVMLLADVSIDATINIDKDITIDGDNHTINSSVTDKFGLFYVNTKTCAFTVQNTTLEGNRVGSLAVRSYNDNDNSGNNITLTNSKVQNFTGWPGGYVGAVYAFSHSHLTLKNCTFSGNTTAQSTNGASGADVWAGAATTVVINGGNYNEVFANTDKSSTESITITGGATITELAVCVSYKEDGSTNTPVIVIDGSTVTNLTTEEGNPISTENITLQNDGSITNMPAEEVAKILSGTSTKAFATIADAITAATSGNTITLLADVQIETINDWKDGVSLANNEHKFYVTNFTVVDGVTVNVPIDFIAKTATYARSVAGNEWGTVCVPFNLKSCDAYKLYQVENISGDVLNITEIDTAEPGTPVIFQNTNKIASLTFTTSDADVKAAAPTNATLVGTYTKQTITTGLSNIYYINGDKFHQAKASLTVPAYRAYINYPSTSAKPAVLQLVLGDATGVEAITTDMNDAMVIYDANGRRLSAPQKGLNIMKLANGKTVKLIIK